MKANRSSRSKHLDFIILDIISIVVSFFAAYLIRFDNFQSGYQLDQYRNIGIAILIIYLLLLLFSPVHSKILKRGFFKELWHVILANGYMALFVFGYLFAFKISATYSRIVIGLFFIANICMMTFLRTFRKYQIKSGYRNGKHVSNTVIITYRDTFLEFFKTLDKNNTGFYNYVGVVLLDDESEYDDEISWLLKDRGIEEVSRVKVLEFVKEHAVNDAFIMAKSYYNKKMVDDFLAMGVTVYFGLNMELGAITNASVENVGDYTLVTSSISTGTSGELFVKRLFDIIVGLIGTIFTGILYIFVAPIIKIQSPGPAFFAQERMGKNGKVFKMYKFRSMYMDAEERKAELMEQNQMQGLMFKMDDDPRITPIGKFIRKTSIDEFPQFWNILKGDMSFVGTRPPTKDEYMQYDMHHLSRLAIKPGLTGMWQVSGRSEITDFEEVVKLDNEYIRNFSLWMDIKIILKTFGAVLGQKGSV